MMQMKRSAYVMMDIMKQINQIVNYVIYHVVLVKMQVLIVQLAKVYTQEYQNIINVYVQIVIMMQELNCVKNAIIFVRPVNLLQYPVYHVMKLNNTDIIQVISVYARLVIMNQIQRYVQNVQINVQPVKVLLNIVPVVIQILKELINLLSINVLVFLDFIQMRIRIVINVILNVRLAQLLTTNVQVVISNQIQIECLYLVFVIVKKVILMMEYNFNAKIVILDVRPVELKKIIVKSARIFNPPTCNCKDGYYEDEQLICQICASQCNTCILQPTNFLSCNPGRIEKDCKCIDGYFEIGLTLCSQCAFQCAPCELDPLNCKTCKGNRIQEPKCICQFGYFDDQLNEDCQKCDITCLECNINGCLSCFANRLLDQDMNCIPPPNSIWYDSTPWCSTCEVAVIKAYFSDDLSQIIIHFDFPLNPKGFSSQIQINKCLQIFEVESAKSFGQNSVCYLNQEDNQELLISLGENSKIQVGEQILFKSNALSQINCETTLKIFIIDILQMPINPLPPQIQYHLPLHKLNPLSDNSIYLKSIKNYGYRKLDNIIWSYQMMVGEDSSNTLSQFLDQINFVQEYNLLIPKLTLPKDAELKFKISYENFIHINSQTELLYTLIQEFFHKLILMQNFIILFISQLQLGFLLAIQISQFHKIILNIKFK